MPRHSSTHFSHRSSLTATTPYSPPISPLTKPNPTPTLRKPSAAPHERKLSTGASAHDPPITDSDSEPLTTDIATKLLWKLLDHNFLNYDTPVEDLEYVDKEWIRSFGGKVLGAYEVKLRDRVAMLRAERAQRVEMRSLAQREQRCGDGWRGQTGSLRVRIASTSGTRNGLPTPTSPHEVSGKAPFEAIEDDESLWADKEMEVEKRNRRAEREIRIARDLHEGAWRWVEAHLDVYARNWSFLGGGSNGRLGERGDGDLEGLCWG